MFANLSPISKSSPSHLYSWKGNGSAKEPTGLKNLGNTCFANSVLQCLFHCHKFYGSMLQSKHRLTCTATECIECAIENCIIEMHNGSTNPTTALIKLLPQMSGGNLSYGRQEDAHEFLISLIMSIKHNDVNTPSKDEHISRLFQGVFLSRICCYNCRTVSSKEDPSVDIALDISKSKSLFNAFTDFCEVERLSGDNSYNCSVCKATSLAQKCLRLQSCPNVLIIQLKRFTYDETGRTTKLNHWVEFPECLDLHPFIYREKGKNGGSTSDCYELKSIVLHMGSSSHSGHYISYVKVISEKGLRSWYKVDDLTVTQVPATEALNQPAYLLFYERISEKEYKLLVARQQFALDRPFYSEFRPRTLPPPQGSVVAAPSHTTTVNGSAGKFIQRSRPATVRYDHTALAASSSSPINHKTNSKTDQERHRSHSVPLTSTTSATSVSDIYSSAGDEVTAVVSSVNHINLYTNPMKTATAAGPVKSPGSEGKRKYTTPGLSYDQYQEDQEDDDERFSYENYYRRSSAVRRDIQTPATVAREGAQHSQRPQENDTLGSLSGVPGGVTPLNDLLAQKFRLSDINSPNKKRKTNEGESIDLYKEQPIREEAAVNGAKKHKKQKLPKEENMVESGLRFLGSSIFSAFKSVRKSLIRLTTTKKARAERKAKKSKKKQSTAGTSMEAGVQRRLWSDSGVKAPRGADVTGSHLPTVHEDDDEEEDSDDVSVTSEDENEEEEQEGEDWDDILSHDKDRGVAREVEEEPQHILHHKKPHTINNNTGYGSSSPVLDVSDIIFEEEDSRFYLGTEPSTPGVATTPFRQQREPLSQPPLATPNTHNLSYGSIYSVGNQDDSLMNTSSLSVHRAISEYRASLGVTEGDTNNTKTPIKTSSMNSLYVSSAPRVPLSSMSYSPYTSSYKAWPSSSTNAASAVKSSRIITQLPPPPSANRVPGLSAFKAPPKDIPLWQQQLNYLQSQMKTESSDVKDAASTSVILNKVLFEGNEENS